MKRCATRCSITQLASQTRIPDKIAHNDTNVICVKNDFHELETKEIKKIVYSCSVDVGWICYTLQKNKMT